MCTIRGETAVVAAEVTALDVAVRPAGGDPLVGTGPMAVQVGRREVLFRRVPSHRGIGIAEISVAEFGSAAVVVSTLQNGGGEVIFSLPSDAVPRARAAGLTLVQPPGWTTWIAARPGLVIPAHGGFTDADAWRVE